MNFKIPNKIRRASKLEKKSLERRGLKLCEEAGELAAEILKLIGEKGRNGKTKSEILAALKLEAVDVTLMALDILCRVNATDKEINEIMEKQNAKWLKWMKGKKKN
jgi:NTP pyrophosphatase (non-canonical NTP hydrolase)